MSVTYGFYDSLNGDRKYNAKQISELFDGLIRDGVFMSIGDAFVVSVGGGMNITVGTGRAWFNHTWTYNDAPLILQVDQSEIALNRIDTVVLEVNSNIDVRANTIKIVKGVPSSEPVATELVRNEFVNQYPLAYIYVSAGVTEITAANITNTVGTSDCPFVTGILETVDIDTLLAQWDGEFHDWIQQLEEILDEDTAGNLLNLINAIKADNTYQTPTIVGTQIQLIKQSDTTRLFFKLDADLSGGAITISLDEGATSKPLVDIDGVAVTELSKGFVEVVENAVNFTYAPKGGKVIKGLIITPSTVNQAIPKGMHDGLGYVKGDANLLAENIKKDKNIFDVIGTLSECKTFSQSFSQPKGSKSITLSASPGFTPVLVIGKVTLSFQESSSSWSNLLITQIRVSDYFSSSGLDLFDKLLTYKYGSSEREMNGVEDGYGWGEGAFVTAGGGINYTTTRTVNPTDYGCQGVTSCSVTCYYME